jgi:butyrate kinase
MKEKCYKLQSQLFKQQIVTTNKELNDFKKELHHLQAREALIKEVIKVKSLKITALMMKLIALSDEVGEEHET